MFSFTDLQKNLNNGEYDYGWPIWGIKDFAEEEEGINQIWTKAEDHGQSTMVDVHIQIW